MGLTINELVTKFKFEVDQAGLNKYDDAIKKARNTDKKATKEKLDDIDKLFKQFNDNKSKEAKIKNALYEKEFKELVKLENQKNKWLNDHNKLELKYIKEKESIRNKINALNVKDANTRVKESKAQIEAELKGYKLKQDAVKWLADLKAKKASQELQDQIKIRNEQDKLNAANRKNLAEYNSRNRMAKLDALLEERRLQRQNHKERLDQLRQERRDRLGNITELAGLGYGAKNTFDKFIASPTKVASDMEKANIFLQTFGDTDAQGQKYIQKKIKEGAKLGAAMPLDIEQMVIELGKAGYKGKGYGDKNELAKMIPYIMKLSRATGGSATEAGELLTNTAASFNINSDSGYSQLTDMFVYALNESKLSFSDLSSALKLSGGASGATAQSIPTVLANMAIARNKGITQSTIGSSGRQISLRPTSIADNIGTDIKKRGKEKDKPIAKAYKALGITESDILTKGGGLDLNKLFGYLRKKFKMNDTDLEAISLDTYTGPQKKSQLAIGNIMKDLFGMTSVSMAMALLRETKRDKQIREGFSNKKYIGSADEVTGKLNKGLDYQMIQAEIEWYYAKQNFGKQFLPIATKLAKALTDMAEAFSNMTPKDVGFVNYVGILATALSGLLVAAKGFNMIAPLLGKSWYIGFGPVGLVALAIADLISYLTGGPSLTGGLIWSIQSLEKWLTGGKLGKALGEMAYDFIKVGGGLDSLINGFTKLYNKIKDLMGLSGGATIIPNFGIETPVTPKQPRKSSGQIPFLRGKEPNTISKFIAKPVMASGGGGTTHKSSRNDTVVTINQVINANNSGTPERIGQIVQDVTKKNLTMINSMKAQRVTAF